MAVKAVTLEGDVVTDGVEVRNGIIEAGDDGENRLMAVGLDPSIADYRTVNVGLVGDGTIVLQPTEEVPETSRCIVFVHEYSPGSGRKRWPSFHINWDEAGEVRKLARRVRSSGSGSDEYSLVLAPMDWPSNIAGQFINERDQPGQTISYKPGIKPRVLEASQPSVQDSPSSGNTVMAEALRKAGVAR